ncbi:MAG: hypothetical protein Q8K47_09850 [Nitrosomonas sp.]|nr:hypothetical protein [Nitrosomonas sp.]
MAISKLGANIPGIGTPMTRLKRVIKSLSGQTKVDSAYSETQRSVMCR